MRVFKFFPLASKFLRLFTYPYSLSPTSKKKLPFLSKAFSCVHFFGGRNTGFKVCFGFKS